MDSNTSQAQVELWNMTFGYLKTMSLRCALALGIPDTIDSNSEPMTLTQLHSALALPPSKKSHLRRLMRLLTHFGFFTEKRAEVSTEVVYDLTAQSRLVTQKNESTNMLPFVRCHVDDEWLKPSLYMADCFMLDNNQIPAELAHGYAVWEMARVNPKVNKMFNEAMISSSCLFSDVITKNGDVIFKGIESLVDVGGGRGAMAQIIAKNFSHVKCIVLDLPHVVAEAPNDGIVNFVSGDMFNFIPPANAVLLKIALRYCGDAKDAIPSKEAGGKVIVLEAVVGSTSAMISEEPQLLFDMLIMTVTGGEERDENEWKKLFMDAGFNSYKITHTVGFMSVIEIYP